MHWTIGLMGYNIGPLTPLAR